jgi:hypothetical protein
MNAVAPTLKQLADEAEFQLTAAKEQLEWFAAIARAIVLDVEHGGGRDTRTLAQLANYLDDTGMTGTDAAIEKFREIATAGCATQKAKSENVSPASAEGAQ